MTDATANLSSAVGDVRRLFDDLDLDWGDHSATIRTWHEITVRVADIDKVIRREQAKS